MERVYAQVLYKLVESGMVSGKAVHALKEKLERDGRGALLPRVARAFARLAEREGSKSSVVITVARGKDERHAKAKAREVLDTLGEADLKVQVDDSIIGGWRVEGRGMLVDNSYKAALLDTYNRIMNH